MSVRIQTVDMHTGGEPLRILRAGAPEPLGSNVLERRDWLKKNADWVRQALMWEPRGHADMYGCSLVPPNDEGADFGAIFMHNEGYSTMCGHATLALARFAVDEGLAADSSRIVIDVPAGRLIASATYGQGKYVGSSFVNVPSFVYQRDKTVAVEGIGDVAYDVVYGGAFYAVVDAESVGVGLGAEDVTRLIELGRKIKEAVRSQGEPQHPFEPDLGFLYGVIFTGAAHRADVHSRNVCVFADGEVDRSPTGSGVSGRIALHVARDEVGLDETITIESVVGSTMSVRAIERQTYGPYEAVVPEVSGASYYTGRAEFEFEEDDPLAGGFLLR